MSVLRPTLYDGAPWVYLWSMATITTRQNQRSTALAARRVGGYSELIRLSGERKRSSAAVVARDASTGRFSITIKPPKG